MNERITLMSPMFSDAMETADAALINLVAKMKRKGADTGGLTISIKIEMNTVTAEDPNTGIETEISVPEITYKATYSVKDSESLGGRNGGNGFGIISKDGIPQLIELDGEQINIFGE